MSKREIILCSKATDTFSERLTEIYKENINGNKDLLVIKKAIKNWLTKGTQSEYVDKLFSINRSQESTTQKKHNAEKNFPIWWSGFFIEDSNPKTNPVTDMKYAAKELNGFSSLDTIMSIALNEQNDFWQKCGKLGNFKWGKYISESYTKHSLKSNPKNIGLFLNKNVEDFLKTQFFNNEVILINKHYKNLNKRVNMHIFNLNKNCNEIIDILSKKNHNIVFHCYEENCKNLTECIKNMKIIHIGKNISKKSSTYTKKKPLKRKRQTIKH